MYVLERLTSENKWKQLMLSTDLEYLINIADSEPVYRIFDFNICKEVYRSLPRVKSYILKV